MTDDCEGPSEVDPAPFFASSLFRRARAAATRGAETQAGSMQGSQPDAMPPSLSDANRARLVGARLLHLIDEICLRGRQRPSNRRGRARGLQASSSPEEEGATDRSGRRKKQSSTLRFNVPWARRRRQARLCMPFTDPTSPEPNSTHTGSAAGEGCQADCRRGRRAPGGRRKEGGGTGLFLPLRGVASIYYERLAAMAGTTRRLASR